MKATLTQLDQSVGNNQFPGPLTLLAASADLRLRAKNRLEHLWETVTAELRRANKHRADLVQQMAQKDEKTDEVMRNPNGTAQFANRAIRERCEKEIEELFASEVELPGDMFEWDDFRTRPNAETLKVRNALDEFSAIQYGALKWLVKPRAVEATDDEEEDVLDLGTDKAHSAAA